jgi:hypothetical protein
VPGALAVFVREDKVIVGHGEHVHAGCAGGSDIEAPGRLGVQAGGRLAVRHVFPRDHRCELVAQGERLDAWENEAAGWRRTLWRREARHRVQRAGV